MSDGWHNIEDQRDSNGNPTAVAKAIQAIIDSGCECEENERDGECTGECFPGLAEAAIHEQFDEIARLRTAIAPRAQSPELAEAESWLRSAAAQQHGKTPAIADELDRLRASERRHEAEVERMRGLIRTAAQVGQQAAGGKPPFSFQEWMQKVDELCDALKLSKPAPAQGVDRATRDMEKRVALWDAINEYASMCGADTSKHISVGRMTAVAKVEAIVFTAERVSRKEAP